MKINWRAVFGLPVLVEFADGQFGVRRGCCQPFYQYLGLDDNVKNWWHSEDTVAKYSHASRERAEQRLVSLYKRKHKATDVRAVHPTNIKALIAEHLLTQASELKNKEEPLTPSMQHIADMLKQSAPSMFMQRFGSNVAPLLDEHEAKLRVYEQDLKRYTQLAQAAMSAIHIKEQK